MKEIRERILHLGLVLMLITALVMGYAASPLAGPAPPAKPLKLLQTSTRSTTSVYIVGQSTAELWTNKLKDWVNVTNLESGGSFDNMMRLKKGQAHMAACNGIDAIRALWKGEDKFKGQPMKTIRWLYVHSGMGSQLLTVRANQPIYEPKDLEGKKVSPGGTGSSGEAMTMKVFDYLGIKPDWYLGSLSQAVSAMKNREIVGYVKWLNGNHLDATQLDLIAFGIRLRPIGFTKEQRDICVKKDPYSAIFFPIKKGFFKEWPEFGGPPPLYTCGNVSGGIVTTNIPQQVGYLMTKVLFENMKDVKSAYPSFHPDTPQGTVEALENITYDQPPLHAGTVQYFEEIGIKVPKRLIPPEYKRK